MDFTALVEAFLRRVEGRRLQRLAAELWKFAEALDVWLHHLFAHPNTDWPEQLNTFLAWQEAEGRRAMPQSRQSLVDYLTWWSTSIGLEPASPQRAPVAVTSESSGETSAMTPDEETEAEHSAGGYPEAFGTAAGMLEEDIRSRSALAMPPLVSEPPPVPDRTPRIVKIEEIKGFWDDYQELLASGQYEQGWWESISYSFASVVLPSSERSIKITFDDGTVLILLGGGPDSDALAGQATVILGAHGAVVGSGTLWQAVVAALKHLGRETAETVADNVVQEVTGLPVGPSSLPRTTARGKVRPSATPPTRVPTKLRRPKLRKQTRQAIENAAKKTPEGKFIDPGSNKVFEGKFHYGHKPGREHRRLVAEAEERGMTQQEFNDWVNSHPEWFQVEDPKSNLSHHFEKPRDD